MRCKDYQPDVVSVGGVPLGQIPLGNTANYTLYGADVTAFGGRTEELRFEVFGLGGFTLDSIEFSPLAVPEPGIWSLFLAGLGFVGWKCWQRRNKCGC